jgi:hypothetical protein
MQFTTEDRRQLYEFSNMQQLQHNKLYMLAEKRILLK